MLILLPGRSRCFVPGCSSPVNYSRWSTAFIRPLLWLDCNLRKLAYNGIGDGLFGGQFVFNGQGDGVGLDVSLKPVGSVCLVNIRSSSQHTLAFQVNASSPCLILCESFTSFRSVNIFGLVSMESTDRWSWCKLGSWARYCSRLLCLCRS